MKLGAVLVMAPDIDEALRFYRDTLGLDLMEQFAGHLVFDLGATRLHVFRCERDAPVSDHARDGGSVIAFETSSIDQTMASLMAKGVRFLHESPAFNPETNLRYAAFRAPGGIVHELIEYLGEGSVKLSPTRRIRSD